MGTIILNGARETSNLRLARNVTAARIALGWTQEHLAEVAQLSRATVIQIEHGLGDPRLSTLAQLAHSFGISVFWLLLGTGDVKAMAELVAHAPPDPRLRRLSSSDLTQMEQLVSSGLIRNRKRAAQRGAALAYAAGLRTPAAVTTAIGTSILPGGGTLVGATLGERCLHRLIGATTESTPSL